MLTIRANSPVRIAARKVAMLFCIAIATTLTLVAAPQSSAQSANSLLHRLSASHNVQRRRREFLTRPFARCDATRRFVRCSSDKHVARRASRRRIHWSLGQPQNRFRTLIRKLPRPVEDRFQQKIRSIRHHRLLQAVSRRECNQFGGGVDYKLNPTNALRIEVRDYYAFSEPRKQNLALRMGWVMYLIRLARPRGH